jgi:hypothetical protein
MSNGDASTGILRTAILVALTSATACGTLHAQKTARVSAASPRGGLSQNQPARTADPLDAADSPRVAVSIQDAVSMRIHHVSLEFLDEVRFRCPSATIDDAVSMRIHHVTFDFLDALQLRYPSASIQDAVGMQIHHVTLIFLDAVRQRDPSATIADAVSMRIHGVTLEFVDELQRRVP